MRVADHVPAPIPPVEIESADTPFTVAKDGSKRQLHTGRHEEFHDLLIFFSYSDMTFNLNIMTTSTSSNTSITAFEEFFLFVFAKVS